MANATCFGVVGEFDSEKEEINAYCERFELFFEANGITEAKQRRAIFLASVGPQLYKLIRTLSGNKPDGKTNQELKELGLRHLKPRPNIISQVNIVLFFCIMRVHTKNQYPLIFHSSDKP